MRNANDQLHFLQGKIEGLEEYAWWKDGVCYVGTCGTTLKDATTALKIEIEYIRQGMEWVKSQKDMKNE
jgi:hypothetical protein